MQIERVADVIPFELAFYGMHLPTCYGTAFAIAYAGKDWIITAQHNLEVEELNLTGKVQYDEVRPRQPRGRTIKVLDGRAVVAVRTRSKIADCAAVEARPGDLPDGVVAVSPSAPLRFPGLGALSTRGALLTPEIGPPVVHNQAPDGHYSLTGYSNAGSDLRPMQSLVVSGYSYLPVPETFMIAYHPGGPKGFSGGPILRREANGSARLVGINTHTSDTRVGLGNPPVVWAKVEAGCGVRIELLLRALGRANASGPQVVDVQLS